MFDAEGIYSQELALAHSAARGAAEILLQRTGGGGADLPRRAVERCESALAKCVVLARGPQPHRWVCHADARTVCVALICTAEEPEAVMSLVHRPADDETAYATLDGGAYVLRGEAAEPEVTTAGGASMSAE
eukprot:5844595-Prymnesium_polylepis.1